MEVIKVSFLRSCCALEAFVIQLNFFLVWFVKLNQTKSKLSQVSTDWTESVETHTLSVHTKEEGQGARVRVSCVCVRWEGITFVFFALFFPPPNTQNRKDRPANLVFFSEISHRNLKRAGIQCFLLLHPVSVCPNTVHTHTNTHHGDWEVSYKTCKHTNNHSNNQKLEKRK